MRYLLIVFVFFSISVNQLKSQDPLRFADEISQFEKLTFSDEERVIIFTGSSSVRLWEDIRSDCSGGTVLNTGFGGSQMSDLLHYLDETVLRFKPAEVYIYEGDNDINAGKNPQEVINVAIKITNRILAELPGTKINFIGAKPSPSRWQYKDDYVQFNALLKSYCEAVVELHYLDVWNPMINEAGRPDPTIFIEDSLHMNRKGYLLWKDIICSESKD